MANPDALGRFKPGRVSFGGDYTDVDKDGRGLNVTLDANVQGTPIRFTINESLDSIASSATLTVLNASMSDTQLDTVMGDIQSEEDIAKYGPSNSVGSIDPNTIVTVTESGGGLGSCTSKWRVISVTSYWDDNGVPYYDLQLEGLGQIALDYRLDPQKLGVSGDSILVMQQSYFDALKKYMENQNVSDGYQALVSDELDSIRVVVDDPSGFINYFLKILDGLENIQCGSVKVAVAPLYRVFTKGESVWQIVDDILAVNGMSARFNRVGRMIVYED